MHILGIILGIIFYSTQAFSLDIGLHISSKKDLTVWGDHILGQDLKTGLEYLKHNVTASYIDENNIDEHTDIDVYMRGFVPYNPPKKINKNKKNIMYLYYPIELSQTSKYKNLKEVIEPDWYSLQTELWDFDLIAVSSLKYKEKLDKLGLRTIYAPQFTNPDKFFYEYDETKSHDILFVGRPGYERISAMWAIEKGFDVSLYGNGWKEKAPKKFFKGDYIDNKELHKYYSSAKIVLNDTREDMKRFGFISNRVFDVTASGGFLISDYVEEIEHFYGDSIPMFKNKEELKDLLDYYLSHPEERIKKANKAREITLKYFTNKVVCKNIIDKAYNIDDKENGNNLNSNDFIIKLPFANYSNAIGDYWLSKDLIDGFIENNANIKEYYHNKGYVIDDFYKNAKNILSFQFINNGLEIYDVDKKYDIGKNKIIYLYFPTFIPKRDKFRNIDITHKYNTDIFLDNNLDKFDAIITPAKNTYETLNKRGYLAWYIPQFTNDKKFKYKFNENVASELLFVGSYWYNRESALYALEYSYDVDIYGNNWQNKIDSKYIKGGFINNTTLNEYYSSAKIVLSDHAEDIEKSGLVINRLYDVSAVGAFVISEYSPHIEEIFGTSIPMFKNKEEFKKLVDFYLANPKEREIKAKQAQEITLKNYTNTIAAKKFIEIFEILEKEKGSYEKK